MEYMKWHIILTQDNAFGNLWWTKSYYDTLIAQHFSTHTHLQSAAGMATVLETKQSRD